MKQASYETIDEQLFAVLGDFAQTRGCEHGDDEGIQSCENVTDAHCNKHSLNIKYLDHEDFHYYQSNFINIKQQLMSSWGEQKMKKI